MLISHDLKTRLNQVRDLFKPIEIGIPGVWLLILYAVFGISVIFSLSAYQLQFAITSLTVDGKPVGQWEMSQLHSKWAQLNERHKELEGQLSSKKKTDAQKSLQNDIDKSRINLEEFIKNDPLGKASADYLESLSYLKSKEERIFFVPSFSNLPIDMLTLILVLSMGALGGTIKQTREYLNNKKSLSDEDQSDGAANYIFIPLLGAITALTIFILAKAGVLIVATPTTGGGAPISPFFISFLGIVSGMLSENALNTIQQTGKKWFVTSSEVDRDRWANGLEKAIEHHEKDNPGNIKIALVDILDVTSAQLEEWVDEKKPVPSQQQALIAAYLHKPKRDLFTDISPS